MMGMERSATIEGKNNEWRYHLGREWDYDKNPVRTTLTVMMLNPSTADALKDDPTIRRVIWFAGREGHSGIHVVNLFAFRKTKPFPVQGWKEEHIGPDNEAYLRRYCQNRPVLAAWGANAPAWRVKQVMDSLLYVRWWCLGKTKDGAPRHPLYLKNTQPLEVFSGH